METPEEMRQRVEKTERSGSTFERSIWTGRCTVCGTEENTGKPQFQVDPCCFLLSDPVAHQTQGMIGIKCFKKSYVH